MPERSPTDPVVRQGELWSRRIVGWLYVAIGAVILASIFVPPPEDTESMRGEWMPIVFPMILFTGGMFAFAGYWAMTRPRVHRPVSIALVFVAMVAALVVFRRGWVETFV